MAQTTIKEPKLAESTEVEFIVEEALLKIEDLLKEVKRELKSQVKSQPSQSKSMKKLAKKTKYNAKYLEDIMKISKVKAGNNLRTYATY